MRSRSGAAPPRTSSPTPRFDVNTGMFFSNLVMYFIILATAATLHRAGHREIESARQAAEALRPLAGDAAYLLYALGLIGTGLLAIPVLAGSASFAVAELFGWRAGLSLKPRRARRFYIVIAASILGGMVLTLLQHNPVRVLFVSAVVNGLLAPPLLLLVMLVGGNPRIMGKRRQRALAHRARLDRNRRHDRRGGGLHRRQPLGGAIPPPLTARVDRA